MLPRNHFLLGLIVSFIMYFEFSVSIFECSIFLIATVGIDVDHYLYYVYRKKDWNLKRAVLWFVKNGKNLMRLDKKYRKEFYTGFCFLHGIEILVLIVLLGFFIWNLFYFVALGFLFHLILDYIHQAFWRGRFDKFSIIYDYFKYGDLKFIEELEDLEKIASADLKKRLIERNNEKRKSL